MKRVIGLALVSLLALGLLATPQSQPCAQTGGLNVEPPIEVYQTQASLGKEQVFQGESFLAQASAQLGVKQDFDWRNSASARFNLVATHKDSGQRLTLSQERVSIGPFIGLKAGTIFNYQILSTPLQFPPAAATGQYNVSAELSGIDPQWIWDQVKDRISSVAIDLGSIKYLGLSKPQIGLSLSAPGTVRAGAAFPVQVSINAPDVQQVRFSMYTQKTGENWSLIKENITAAGVASHTENIIAPIYSGELKVIAEASGFTVAGTSLTLPAPTTASTTTQVELPHPTLELAVVNPVEMGSDVPFTITINSPSATIQKLELQIRPSWVKTSRQLTVSLNQGENTFQETADPLSATGQHSIFVRSARYLVGGKWVNLSPPLEARAIVTSGTTPTASLTLQSSAVYPGATVNVQVEAVNPTTTEVIVPYKVYTGGAADSSQQALELRDKSLWEEGGLTIPAGQKKADTLSYVFTNVSALSGSVKYQGFQLVVDGYMAGGTPVALDPPLSDPAALIIKPPLAPLLKITPSASSVDAGGSLTLHVEVKNPMDVGLEGSIELWGRVAAAGQVASLIDRKQVSLGSGQMTRLRFSVTAPAQPVQVEYRAQISETRLAGVGAVSLSAASQTTVTIASLAMPEITLVLNPNPVQAGSSVEARVVAINYSTTQDMAIPISLYLKLPGQATESWGNESISAAAGRSGQAVKHLLIPESWQSLGSARITAEVAEYDLGGSHVVLASPLRASKDFSIIDLRLRAVLQTTVDPSRLSLSYDAQNKFLAASSVGLDGSIIVDNAAGWENSPDTRLRLQVTQSRGVQITEDWRAVEAQIRDLYGKKLTTGAKFSISNPTAERLGDAGFEAKVTADIGGEKAFSFGIGRIEGADWYLDAQARLISKATGQAFLGSIPGAALPQAYLDELAAGKAAQVAELLASIDSYLIDVDVFGDQVEGGATIMPSAQRAWERLQSRGSSLEADLALLKDRGTITQEQYGAGLQNLEPALEELEDLKAVVDEKYGDGPTPEQFTLARFQELVSSSDPTQLSQDPDGDSLSTLVELELGYGPHKWDSQRAGMSDGDYFTASLVPEGQDLPDEERGFLNAYASLYLLDSIGAALEENMEGAGEYGYFSSSTREDLQSMLQDATWEFCQYLLGIS